MIVLVLVAIGCTPRDADEPGRAEPPRPETTEPARAEAVRAEPPPAPIYVADDLAQHILTIDDLASYPPTACRLRHMLGADVFARLHAHEGYYPGEDERREEGFTYFGMRCPQPDCDSAQVWVQPDGGMLVALRSASAVELYGNRAALLDALPSAMQTFVADAPTITRHAPEHALSDPPQCRTPDLEAQRRRFVRARQKLACDRDFSSFWMPAAVQPRVGQRSHFFADASADTRREAFVIAGDLVTLGWPSADDEAFVCAEFVAHDGARTTGWLASADVVALSFMQQPPPRAELERLVIDEPARWLTRGAPFELGELTLSRVSDDRVHVEVERTIAGHVCGIAGNLRLVAPRMLEDIDTGCGTVGVLFNNAVALWEDKDLGCSGARASCSDAYRPAARAP